MSLTNDEGTANATQKTVVVDATIVVAEVISPVAPVKEDRGSGCREARPVADAKRPKDVRLAESEVDCRSVRAIVNRLRHLAETEFGDTYGVRRHKLLRCLAYDHVRPLLAGTSTVDMDSQTWQAERYTPCTRSALIAALAHYMKLAWEIANDRRGILADRSLEHVEEWMWLMGDADHAAWQTVAAYIPHRYYGKERLVAVCDRYKIAWTKWDDGKRVN